MAYVKHHLSISLLAAVIFIIGISVYASSFSNTMFWDDDDFILQNAYIQDWQHFPKLFSENVIAGRGLISNYYRPILLTVFSLEWHAWGDWAPGWHIVNTVTHSGNAILLFLILYQLFNKKTLAFVAALIFLLHPLQTEAVSYVNSFGDSLSVLWMFSGILFYMRVRHAQTRSAEVLWYVSTLLMFVLAILSKETTIIMPGLLFIVDFFSLPKQWTFWHKFRRSIELVLPILSIALVYVFLRGTVLNFQNTFNLYNEDTAFTQSLWVRVLTFFRIITVYIRLIFVPIGLHMERSVAVATSLASADVLLGLCSVVAMVAAALWCLRRHPIVAFGIAWFFIALAPTSNIAVPINGLLYEHWLYVPLVGIVLVVLYVAQQVYVRIEKKRGALAAASGILIFVCAVLAVLTIRRNAEWSTPTRFYTQTLQYAPTSYRVLNNLGMSYANERDFANALVYYQKAVAQDPDNAVAYHNIANTYASVGESNTAIKYYRTALQKQPDFLFSYGPLINLELAQQHYDAARSLLLQYQQYEPTNPQIPQLLKQLETLH